MIHRLIYTTLSPCHPPTHVTSSRNDHSHCHPLTTLSHCHLHSLRHIPTLRHLETIAELRQVTTMFLKLDTYSTHAHEDPLSLQNFFYLLQTVLEESGGFLRQFLVDDKVVTDLPPTLTHPHTHTLSHPPSHPPSLTLTHPHSPSHSPSNLPLSTNQSMNQSIDRVVWRLPCGESLASPNPSFCHPISTYSPSLTPPINPLFNSLSTNQPINQPINQPLPYQQGCVAIAMWGVPCFTYANDCSRGLFCAVSMNRKVLDIGHRCSIGLTTGRVYCGSVGSVNRR